MTKILVVEDDIMLNNGICFNLQSEGYEVINSYNQKDARLKFQNNKIDLIILDINLPDGSGIDLCREIREKSKMGVIFLTACDMESDIIDGFKIGADDYITKPFSINILIQRVQALLRRCVELENSNVLEEGEFEFDFDKMLLSKSHINIPISPIEYRILKKLVQCKNEIVTRSALMDVIWDDESEYVDEHVLTVNINRLRAKIDLKTSNHKYIKTVYGMGYMWVSNDDEK